MTRSLTPSSHRPSNRGLCRRTRLVVSGVLFVALALGPVASFAQDSVASDAQVAEARGIVESLLNSLRETAQDEDLTVPQRRSLLAAAMGAHFDYLALSRQALGPLAEQFTKSQLTDFAVAYSRHMSINFIRRFELSADAPTAVTGARGLPKAAVEVTLEGPERAIGAPLAPTRTRGPAKSRLLLQSRGDRYRITQMRIAGVDPSQTFRAQAQSVLDKGTPNDLIVDLERRNQQFIQDTLSAE